MSFEDPDYLIHAFLLRRRLDTVDDGSRRATMISSLVAVATTAAHLAYRIAEKPSRDRGREYRYAQTKLGAVVSNFDAAVATVLASLDTGSEVVAAPHTSTAMQVPEEHALGSDHGDTARTQSTQDSATGTPEISGEGDHAGWTQARQDMEAGGWTQVEQDTGGMVQDAEVSDTYDDISPTQIVDPYDCDELEDVPDRVVTIDDAAIPGIAALLLPELTARMTCSLPGKLLSFLYDPVANHVQNRLPVTLQSNPALLAECVHVLKKPLIKALVEPLTKKLIVPLVDAISGEVTQCVLTAIKDGVAHSAAGTSSASPRSRSSHDDQGGHSKRLRAE
ncbi:hypothetical protein K466DRAFT_602105 [Polyporus arcularius HHB13444]|uniref:Uncharacterized protein n=1 Tax=Polyporus arcularius HHB13444 TaxID=1314778 RepID=A0A5C3P6S7_9APHY|nr:hypothetical protein K466DRAFT_602105 [Polyporus arcularius HHB13444]